MATVILSMSIPSDKLAPFEALCSALNMNKSEFMRKSIEIMLSVGSDILNQLEFKHSSEKIVTAIINSHCIEETNNETR